MIRIAKGPPPARLAAAASSLVSDMCVSYERDPAPYATGQTKFEFSDGVYSSPAVKSALHASHNSKCCYCEWKDDKPHTHLHVEHFRPKGYVRQTPKGPEIRPGYYWLAYDWNNLLLSCSFCNSSNKRNLFPLADPAARATSHRDDIALERPELLKPDQEDIDAHLDFRREVPFGLTARGRATIAVLGLDDQRHRSRRKYFDFLRRKHELLTALSKVVLPAEMAPIVAEIREGLEISVRPDQPFSAMAVRFLIDHPLPPAF